MYKNEQQSLWIEVIAARTAKEVEYCNICSKYVYVGIHYKYRFAMFTWNEAFSAV